MSDVDVDALRAAVELYGGVSMEFDELLDAAVTRWREVADKIAAQQPDRSRAAVIDAAACGIMVEDSAEITRVSEHNDGLLADIEKVEAREHAAGDRLSDVLGLTPDASPNLDDLISEVTDQLELLRGERDTAEAKFKHAIESFDEIRLGRELTTEVATFRAESAYVDGYARLVGVDIESAEAEEIRDEMDGPWDAMGDAGRARFDRFVGAVHDAVDVDRKRGRVTVEWRQEIVHRLTPHSTDHRAHVLATEWQSAGWQCRNLRGGGHDILLVGCRAIIGGSS